MFLGFLVLFGLFGLVFWLGEVKVAWVLADFLGSLNWAWLLECIVEIRSRCFLTEVCQILFPVSSQVLAGFQSANLVWRLIPQTS